MSSSNSPNTYQTTAGYLSVSNSSSPTPSIASSSQNQGYRFHPVVEGQTDYYNKTFINSGQNDQDSDTMSTYFSPGGYIYNTPPSRQIVSIMELTQMRQMLKSRRVNTLTELRRIERILSSLPTFMPELMNEITDAWGYYVSSNNFLNELRGLTRQYPFSTELLADAKARVLGDANSSRSWNFVWLLLVKIKSDQMISEYAVKTAKLPAMWGGVVPDSRHAAELADVLNREWMKAVDQLLRHWPTPPTVTSGNA